MAKFIEFETCDDDIPYVTISLDHISSFHRHPNDVGTVINISCGHAFEFEHISYNEVKRLIEEKLK